MPELEPHHLPVARQAARIELRRLSPVDLVNTYLDRIDRLDPGLHAYITVCRDEAREAARQAERDIRRGVKRGPLHGIPFAVKDQMHIPGVPLTGGSRVRFKCEPRGEATVVKRLRAAGAILLGTLNTMEFHIGSTRKFPFGLPHNPWRLDRTPGGSSSGSASAVAAGLCSFSLGCDTGGSIRTPASFCGVTGLRATWSRVSRHGVIPLAWSLDAVGPLTKTVEDAAIVLRAIAGHDPLDPTTSARSVPAFDEILADDITGARIGLLEETIDAPEVSTAARQAVSNAVTILEDLGAVVERVSVPMLHAGLGISSALVYSEAFGHHRRDLMREYHAFDTNTRIAVLTGGVLPAGMVDLAQRARVALTRQLVAAAGRFDVLLGATTAAGAPLVPQAKAIDSADEAHDRLLSGSNRTYGQHTRAFALAGLPALTVPCGFDPDGMPLGLHVASSWFSEVALFRVAHAFQSATSWHEARPVDIAG